MKALTAIWMIWAVCTNQSDAVFMAESIEDNMGLLHYGTCKATNPYKYQNLLGEFIEGPYTFPNGIGAYSIFKIVNYGELWVLASIKKMS